jgi:glycosyltransferase involved in cell wall biosynthesis
MKSLAIVVPIYDDWASAKILLERLNHVAKTIEATLFITLVDDGSNEPSHGLLAEVSGLTSLGGVEIVHLALNVGHQRAIAIGLCFVVDHHDFDAVLVMDGDGEDPPESIATLLNQAGAREDFCIVAQRRKRRETVAFRLSYLLYKGVFRLVTGREINFGNFSLISRGNAHRLAMISDLWNNLPAAVLRSRLAFDRVPIDRGQRYAGKSKMNFVSLIVHGMSGIAVYSETIFVRLLLVTILLVLLTFATIAGLLIIRVFYPEHATPGWATTISFGLIIILMQVFFTALTSILTVLHSRVQRLVLPLAEYRPYVASRQLLAGQFSAAITRSEQDASESVIHSLGVANPIM